MLFVSNSNNLAFFTLLYWGVIVGLLYEISVFVCKITKNNLILRNCLDIIITLLGGFLFIISINYVNYGYFRFYLLTTFIAGFTLERISIGFLVAKFCDFVYNKTIKLTRQIRRKCHDSRKTKGNS